MASVSDLPAELLEHIALYLDQSALYALTQVTKSLYKIVVPLLYRHVDLVISSRNPHPRIDRLIYNIQNDAQLGKFVRSLRLGLSPTYRVWDGQRFLPNDNEAQHRFVFERALELLANEALVSGGHDLRAGIGAREYGAYAALLLLMLPSIHRLNITSRSEETLRPLHDVLHAIVRSADQWQSSSPELYTRIASIRDVSYNFDPQSGMRSEEKGDNSKVWAFLVLPGLRKLEFPNTDTNLMYACHPSFYFVCLGHAC